MSPRKPLPVYEASITHNPPAGQTVSYRVTGETLLDIQHHILDVINELACAHEPAVRDDTQPGLFA